MSEQPRQSVLRLKRRQLGVCAGVQGEGVPGRRTGGPAAGSCFAARVFHRGGEERPDPRPSMVCGDATAGMSGENGSACRPAARKKPGRCSSTRCRGLVPMQDGGLCYDVLPLSHGGEGVSVGLPGVLESVGSDREGNVGVARGRRDSGCGITGQREFVAMAEAARWRRQAFAAGVRGSEPVPDSGGGRGSIGRSARGSRWRPVRWSTWPCCWRRLSGFSRARASWSSGERGRFCWRGGRIWPRRWPSSCDCCDRPRASEDLTTEVCSSTAQVELGAWGEAQVDVSDLGVLAALGCALEEAGRQGEPFNLVPTEWRERHARGQRRAAWIKDDRTDGGGSRSGVDVVGGSYRQAGRAMRTIRAGGWRRSRTPPWRWR